MALNKEDKAKIRTATKCYLTMKGEATANQIWQFIEGIDLKLRVKITPSMLARELMYCCNSTQNFLNITYHKDNTNTCIYYLKS